MGGGRSGLDDPPHDTREHEGDEQAEDDDQQVIPQRNVEIICQILHRLHLATLPTRADIILDGREKLGIIEREFREVGFEIGDDIIVR